MGLGLVLYINTSNFIKQAVHTEALIIKLEPSAMHEGEQLYSPILQFKDSRDNMITEKANISTGKREFQVGNTIGIYYNRENPKRFLLNKFTAKWFGVIACSIGVFLILLSSLCCFIIQKIINYIGVANERIPNNQPTPSANTTKSQKAEPVSEK
jgi:hypothetical protein